MKTYEQHSSDNRPSEGLREFEQKESASNLTSAAAPFSGSGADSSSLTVHEVNTRPKPISPVDRQLPVFCPQCGVQVQIQKGLCGNRLIDAILLQARHCGTELECHHCRTRFVFQKLTELTTR